MHGLNVTRVQIYAYPNLEVTPSQASRLRNLIAQRREGTPVAYITGKSHFWNQELFITPDVLIPRPETELLVESALNRLCEGDRVLDLGTGSGAIALALRSELNVDVVATDIDPNVLEVCRTNASRLNLCITMVESDWYSAITGSFDAIVSNPPYVASGDPRLFQSEIRHEPLMALSSGIDGLDALRKVISGAPDYLVVGGSLIIEHGYNQRAEVLNLFKLAGFKDIQCLDDLSHTPRVVFGKCGE